MQNPYPRSSSHQPDIEWIKTEGHLLMDFNPQLISQFSVPVDLPLHQNSKEPLIHPSKDSNFILVQTVKSRYIQRPSNFCQLKKPQELPNTVQHEIIPDQNESCLPLMQIYYKDAKVSQAQKHQSAGLFRRVAEDKHEFCDCCGQLIYGDFYPLTCKLEDLAALGPSVPLFFLLTRNLIVVLGSVFLTFIVLAGVVLYQKDELSMQNLMIPGIFHEPDPDLFNLHFISLIIGVSVYIFLQRKLNYMLVYYSKNQENISNYSVMIDNLPQGTTEEQIKQAFQGLKVERIFFTQDMREVLQLSKKYDKLMRNSIREIKGSRCLCKCRKKKLEILINQTQDKLIQLVKSFDDKVITQVAFVTFQTKIEAQIAFQQLNIPACKMLFFKKNIGFTVSRAPSTDDIFWENFTIPLMKKYKRIIIHIFLGSLLIAIFSFTIYQIRTILVSNQEFDSQTDMNVYQLFLSSAILIVQSIYTKIVYKTAEKVRFKKLSHYKISVGLRLVTLYTVNSGVLFLIISYNIDPGDWNGFEGLANQIIILLLVNSFFVPLYHLFPLSDLFRRVQQFYYTSLSEKTRINKYQIELNRIFDSPVLPLEVRYATVMKMFFITLIFIAVIPIGAVFTVIGLNIYYLAMKYKLLRIEQKPKNISSELGNCMSQLTQIGFLLYVAGLVVIYSQSDVNLQYSLGLIFLSAALIGMINFPLIKNRLLQVKLEDLIKIYRDSDTDYQNFSINHPQNYFSESPLQKLKPKNSKKYSQQQLQLKHEENEIIAGLTEYTATRNAKRKKQKTLPLHLTRMKVPNKVVNYINNYNDAIQRISIQQAQNLF